MDRHEVWRNVAGQVSGEYCHRHHPVRTVFPLAIADEEAGSVQERLRAEGRCIFRARSYLESGNKVAVVCSARSGDTKATGTTNLLLRAALEALRPRAPDLSSSISSLPAPSPAGTPGVSTSDKINPLTSQIFQKTNNATAASTSRSGATTPGSRGVSSLAASLSSLRASDEGPQLFNATVDQIKEDHVRAARAVVRDEAILQELEDDLDYDCERLRSFLLAAQVSVAVINASKRRR